MFNIKRIEFDNIATLIIKNKMSYTGKEIKPLWAFKNFNVQKDSIVAFNGPINVSIDNMKDLKDIKEESKYGNVLIKSSNAINFIVEHFDNPDLKMIYLRQRILVFIVKEAIENIANVLLKRRGDDLYYKNGKLSVCIACRGVSSAKIHMGINVSNMGTPEYVNTSSLEDIGIDINHDSIVDLMEKIAVRYSEEINKIEKDIRKTLYIV